jgi:glutamine---fructose-6-phosphate transaminase (isomerizing)
MCGIFGYYNYNVGQDLRGILDMLFNGLRRLEYRGYDSSGVCVDIIDDGGAADHRTAASGSTSGRIVVLKAEGKIENLQQIAEAYLIDRSVDSGQRHPTHVGISHTRWATHGPPSATNAHPHASDSNNGFVVVHNGIITNYAALKAWLTSRGETFVSETDSEVIPKLCRYVYASLVQEAAAHRTADPSCDEDVVALSGPDVVPFPRLVMEVLKRLEGAYAILVRSSHYPGEMVACKRGSPLIFGVKKEDGEGGTMAADGLGASETGGTPHRAADVSAAVPASTLTRAASIGTDRVNVRLRAQPLHQRRYIRRVCISDPHPLCARSERLPGTFDA